jgi:NAD(P)H-flavin reductase/ferredoxin
MSKICTIEVNGERFSAYRGDLLLDAALMNGIDLPHDCRSGYCGTCRVRVLDGRFFGGQSDDADVVHACQCRVISDMAVAVEEVPEIAEVTGQVRDIVRLAPDVVEVCVEPSQPIHYFPGQYISLQFRGYPARCYSPTVPLDWPSDTSVLRFQVRQIRDGCVSAALGRKILKDHRLKLTGPFGSAYFRPDHAGRLILVSSGTGFAPIWAIAEAAIWEKPERELVLIVGARTVASFYMIPALCRVALFPRVKIISVVSEPQDVTNAVHQGRPTDYLPALSTQDVVYAAGAPAMVETVAQIARAAGVTCFSDPFTPELDGGSTDLLSRAADWFSANFQTSPSMQPTSDEIVQGSRFGELVPAWARDDSPLRSTLRRPRPQVVSLEE